MLTVAILINGDAEGRMAYSVDDGSIIHHDPADGAVAPTRALLGHHP